MGKRIVLTSVGSFGDLHPFISVSLALKARGLDSVIATSEGYRQKIEREGVSFHPVAPGPDQLLEDTGLTLGDIVRKIMQSGTKFIVEKVVMPYVERSYENLCEAMRGADLVVASSLSLVARIAAEKLGLPVVSLLLSPCVFFSAEEPAHFMEIPWLPRFRQVLGARATKMVLDLGRSQSRRQTKRLTAFRRQLGLNVPAGDDVLDGPLRADRIFALYSPLLGPLPPDAPPNTTIAGFTFYDSEAGGPVGLPRALEDFLAADSAPLVFSLGSVGVHAAGDFYETAAATARRLGMRAVLLVGSEAEARLARLSSHDLFVAGYAPHSLIFPRAAAVIHHGGIGTVAQTLRAGRLHLVCPMLGDQADNAERLVTLGVARRLDHKRVTVDRAAEALGSLLADKRAAGRAADLANQVALENGASAAADGIAALLGSPASLAMP